MFIYNATLSFTRGIVRIWQLPRPLSLTQRLASGVSRRSLEKPAPKTQQKAAYFHRVSRYRGLANRKCWEEVCTQFSTTIATRCSTSEGVDGNYRKAHALHHAQPVHEASSLLSTTLRGTRGVENVGKTTIFAPRLSIYCCTSAGAMPVETQTQARTHLVRLPVFAEGLYPGQQRPRHPRPRQRRRLLLYDDRRTAAAAPPSPAASAGIRRSSNRLLLPQVLRRYPSQLVGGQGLVPPLDVVEARGSGVAFPSVGSTQKVFLSLAEKEANKRTR